MNMPGKDPADLKKFFYNSIEQRDLLLRQMQKDFESTVVHHARTRENNLEMVGTANKFISDLSDPDYVHVDMKRLDHAKHTLPNYIENFKAAKAHNFTQIDNCLLRILKHLKLMTDVKYQTAISEFILKNNIVQTAKLPTSTKRETLIKRLPELFKKLTEIRDNTPNPRNKPNEITIAVDTKLVQEINRDDRISSKSGRDSFYIPNNEIFDGIIQKLIELKDSISKISPEGDRAKLSNGDVATLESKVTFFRLLDLTIYDDLNLHLCYYYHLIAASYARINKKLDFSIDECYLSELEVEKVTIHLKPIEKNYQEVHSKIEKYGIFFTEWLRSKHEANVLNYLKKFEGKDQGNSYEEDLGEQSMIDTCKEVIENINLAVNTINDFLDDVSHSRKNNRILNNILSSSFADLALAISPGLSQLENLK